MNILVLNCFSRNSMAVINNLYKKHNLYGGHIRIGNLMFDTIFKTPRLKKIIRHADPAKHSLHFLEEIKNIIACYKIDVIIPTGTTLTDCISEHKKDIESKTGAYCLCGDFELLQNITNKAKFIEICRKYRIPIPKSKHLHSIKEIKTAINQFDFPVLIKPCHSYASRGVRIFETETDYHNYLTSEDYRKSHGTEFILQQKINGTFHDVTSFSWQGKVFSGLTQKREVGLYDFGGGGIVNRTTYEPEMMIIVKKLVNEINWSGMALFDFVKDANGNYLLLECNPKIWGTTELTFMAGLNMLDQWLDILINNKAPVENFDYEKDLVFKWWFPNIVAHWFTKPLSFRNIFRRIHNTLRRYGTRTISNIRLVDLPHLIGVALNKCI